MNSPAPTTYLELLKKAKRIKRVELTLMAPGNKKVLKRLRVSPGPRLHFTEAGAEQALNSLVDRIDDANPGHQWRLVSIGGWKFKLVWADEPKVEGS